jgi:hypothetical protein
MLRLVLLASALIGSASAAQAAPQKSVLSSDDAGRQICVPLRDGKGNPTGKQMCRTGRQWEKLLAQRDEIRPAQVRYRQPFLANYGTGPAWRF